MKLEAFVNVPLIGSVYEDVIVCIAVTEQTGGSDEKKAI
jgi:hypothetical protein